MSATDPTAHSPLPVAPAPLWIRVWLALLAPLYFFAPVAVFALPGLRRLPRAAWWVLGFYALSQQLPALLTPEPLINSGLALARTLLMFSFVALGASLNGTRPLAWLGIGLAAVYATALGLTLADGLNPLAGRLGHPYMTAITLGLAGAAGIWLALFAKGHLLWRLPLGLAGLGILLLSGSRGPLAAALLGCALGFVVRRGRRAALGLLAGTAVLAGGVYGGRFLELPAISRLNSADTSGRDVIWNDVLSVIRSEPVSGVGSYRLGARLTPPGRVCTLWPGAEGTSAPCPAWVQRLGQPWIIAHNVTLQQLAETGPLGLTGLFTLLGVVGAAAWRQRDPLAVAVLSGLLLATANDNTLLVPGPFVGELFWVTAGAVLVRLPAGSPAVGWAGGLTAAGLLTALSIPLLSAARPVSPAPAVQLSALIAPRTVANPHDYQAFVRLALPAGRYRLALRSCAGSCVTVSTVTVQAPASGPAPTARADCLDRSVAAVSALTRTLALGALPLAAALGLAQLAGRPPSTDELQRPTPSTACPQPPVFTPGYQRGENYVVPQGEGFKFRSEAWLEATVCSAGTLTITADGELAGDEWPQLTVALNGAVLATPGFDQERMVNLRVPAAGRLYLAYLNDYYLADVRVATLRDVALSAPTCQDFRSVTVPKESGGAWNPQNRVASLVRAGPMTLVPCAAGKLTLRVYGREGHGAFPVLTFQQGGRTLKTLTTGLEAQTIQLDLSADPLTITLTNPYGETLADRNLNVRQIIFTPDSSR